MAGGLAALLDDVATLARAAAASVDDIGAAAGRASVKAAGVVVDDTAVTPQYVHGLAAERELPIIRRIAVGSLRNKLLIILPAIMLLSQFLPFLLTPILMLGGAYLCYEGAEKVWEKFGGGHHGGHGAEEQAAPDEDTIVSGAVRTDFILSAEIMVISLNEVADEPFLSRLFILVIVAIGITVLVYGVVGLIVKMDDVGLNLSERPGKAVSALGRGLVRGMPKLLAVLTVVGIAAMLWVGGHILLVGSDELGLHVLYDTVHHLEEAAHEATGALGGLVGWLVNTLGSAVLGLVVGGLIVLLGSLTWHRRKKHTGEAGHADETGHATEHRSDGAPADGNRASGAHASGAGPGGEPETR
ncbi:DUF808 domain-containing protein [Geodermatophilus sp. SYSU D00691]